jgi:hypothetical protein
MSASWADGSQEAALEFTAQIDGVEMNGFTCSASTEGRIVDFTVFVRPFEAADQRCARWPKPAGRIRGQLPPRCCAQKKRGPVSGSVWAAGTPALSC